MSKYQIGNGDTDYEKEKNIFPFCAHCIIYRPYFRCNFNCSGTGRALFQINVQRRAYLKSSLQQSVVFTIPLISSFLYLSSADVSVS